MSGSVVARFGLTGAAIVAVCAFGTPSTGAAPGAPLPKGNMLKAARIAPRAVVTSYSVSRGEGRGEVVMRVADGREAFRADQERGVTIVVRNVEVPPLPEQGVPAAKPAALTAPPQARRGNPLGCERALSGLVKASALSESRCLT